MTAPRPEDWRRWGVDPAWSRRVTVEGHEWHLLDRPGSDPAAPTVVCVHGNPTWSILWAPVLAAIPSTHRVVAPDQLDMGWSERTEPRRYARRVRDLEALLDALGVHGPVVLVGHDWGGAIAMGWAVDHRDRVAGMVLANTGIAVPAGRAAPRVIRLAARRGVLGAVTRRTPLFVAGTARLPGSGLDAEVRRALRAPYRRAADRAGIERFVADVPFDHHHPSAADLDRVATQLAGVDAPVLVISGSRDPVFDDDFAEDLATRFPHARVHRVAGSTHLSPLHHGVADTVATWITDLDGEPDRDRRVTTDAHVSTTAGGTAWRPLCHELDRRADDDALAFADGATGRTVSFADLSRSTVATARLLRDHGVRPGDRIGILVPPSIELVTLVYACWRLGAVPVVADRGLGLRALGDALTSARPDHLVGPRAALVVARGARWAPRARRLRVEDVVVVGGADDASVVDAAGARHDELALPGPDAPAAVLFTSGATGPAKGVRYTHGQLAAQRDALTECYGLRPDDAFVAAFAPFALYGPALGLASAVPDVDVTAPGSLTADVLEDACDLIGATLVFASPAALANVVRTAGDRSRPALASVRTVMSAGAPVPVATLRAMSRLAPGATLHTPYGMTECLPVADVDLATLELVGDGRGVCVGPPVRGAEVFVAPLGLDAGGPLAAAAEGATGELLVRAPWASDGYDRRWRAERDARPVDREGRTWHRTGDVGHVDADGRVWVEGRSVHVVETALGPVTPVPIEVAVERLDGVSRAAAVGIGPAGSQSLVVVVEPEPAPSSTRVRRLGLARVGDRVRASRRRRPTEGTAPRLADGGLSAEVRAAVAPLRVAAVCEVDHLPVDIRHEAKIDRLALASRVAALLEGATS